MDYITSEPQDTSIHSTTPSAVLVSMNPLAAPSSPPLPSSTESPSLCDCGNPIAKQICKDLDNPKNLDRMMYLYPRLKGRKCSYFQWKDETSQRTAILPAKDMTSQLLDTIKQETKPIPIANKMQEREINPADSDLTPPTSPQHPPRPQETYTCNCGKPAKQFFCRNDRPENINKYYYKYENKKCSYWKWIENGEDEQKHINANKRKRNNDEEGTTKKKFICNCGQPARQLWIKNGMKHNHGRSFYSCKTRRCHYWI